MWVPALVGRDVLVYENCLVLQLQRHVERIDLIPLRTWPIVTKDTLSFDIAISTVGRDTSIVARDDIVHTVLKLLPHGAVQWTDARKPHIWLEPSDADLIGNEVQAVGRPRMAIENAETSRRRSEGAGPIVGEKPLEFTVERKHTHVVRENLFDQQVDGQSGEIRHISSSEVPSSKGGPCVPCSILLVLHVSGNREDIPGCSVIGTGCVIAWARFIVQQIPLQTPRVHQAVARIGSVPQSLRHARNIQ